MKREKKKRKEHRIMAKRGMSKRGEKKSIHILLYYTFDLGGFKVDGLENEHSATIDKTDHRMNNIKSTTTSVENLALGKKKKS